ncbi:MAG: DUF4012 domain-containing protein [Patescibacteria group bacterium]|nr:DUF4012 domain-containing protein [Patescibacteria group bacterium]
MKYKANLIYAGILTLRLLLAALVLFLLALIISFILSWQSWRSFVANGLQAKDQLSLALVELQNKNWPDAKIKLESAEIFLLESRSDLQKLQNEWLPAKFKIGSSQINDLKNLNDTGLILTRSALQVSVLAQNLSASSFIATNNFNDLDLSQKENFLQALIALEPELNGLKANLDLAVINLDRIHPYGILWPIKGQLSKLRIQIDTGHKVISESLPILRLLPAFSGYPQTTHYLIMLQNNDELRPTGGFLGSYVRLDIANFGEIKRLEADDIYHLDMPAIGKTNFEAPAAISKYLKVDNWYLRDANWSPDWPQSARQIQTMFQAESAAGGLSEPELDGVLAITPDFVASLLKITGPIIVRGQSYAPENMQALLQYNVEVAYKDDDISSWDRKDIINELINALRDKLTQLPLKRYPDLLNNLYTSINRGDLLIYFNNPQQQILAKELGASGAIIQGSGDYLMVVDANLAAFKSDAVMKKNISYKIDSSNNRLIASLRLNYQHGGGFDWRTTRYRSYTRILAPLGSELKEISNINQTEADFISYDDLELNKHVFGFFWSIEPGQSKEVKLSYYLPANINNSFNSDKLYTLFVQRQPGSQIENFSLTINSNKEILKSSSLNLSAAQSKDAVFWTSRLESSQYFQVLTK